MNIYKLRVNSLMRYKIRGEEWYDRYNGFIVQAPNEQVARQMCIHYDCDSNTPQLYHCKLIGKSLKGQKMRIILQDFHAA